MERKVEKKAVLKLSDFDRKIILSYVQNVPDPVIKPALTNTSHVDELLKVE